jgi:hypothetical protein
VSLMRLFSRVSRVSRARQGPATGSMVPLYLP